MKSPEIFKKIISSFLLVSIVFVSGFYSYPVKARAQSLNIAGGGNASGGFNMQGIGGVIAGCGVSFFAARKAIKAAEALSERSQDIVGDAVGGGVNAVTGINVTNVAQGIPPTPRVPVVDDESIVSQEKAVGEVNTEATLQSFKEECLDIVARYGVLKVMDKITFMTVEWINSGFDGNPFYPENRENFFEQIAKDEVTSFTSWFSMNPEDYPFGRIISETILLTVQNRLQDNLRFSLNQVLQHSNQYANYANFQARFSVGGWAGYTAFAQPNNNVFGNYLLAQNHLATRTAGTNITVAANFQRELQEAGGILNQRICRLTETGDPNDEYFGRGDERYMGDYSLMPPNGVVSEIIELLPPAIQNELAGLSPFAQREMYNYFVQRSKCAKWETVTPGRFVAEQTSQVLGSPLRSLELADEMNENLGLIFDALALQLFDQGLRSFQRIDGQYSSNPNDPNYNAAWAQSNNQDFGATSGQPTLTESIQGDGINPGAIQLQQEYLQVAEANLESVEDIITSIRALDYCIPGPNPRWYQNSYQNLQTLLQNIPAPYTGVPSEDQQYYKNTIQELTGINISPTPLIGNQTQFNQFMLFVLNKYSDAISERYSLNNTPPPSMRPTASNLYNQITSYQTSLDIYQNQINNLAPVMPQLIDIQNQLLALSAEEQNDPSNPQMQILSSLFNQVASQGVMVSQAQYSQAQIDANTYTTQISYINGLINSCVGETSAPAYSGEVERTVYPFQSAMSLPAVQSIAPNTSYFIDGYQFGETSNNANIIDLSAFGGGIDLANSPASGFSDFLQSVF